MNTIAELLNVCDKENKMLSFYGEYEASTIFIEEKVIENFLSEDIIQYLIHTIFVFTVIFTLGSFEMNGKMYFVKCSKVLA